MWYTAVPPSFDEGSIRAYPGHQLDSGYLRYAFMAHPPPRLRWWLLALAHKRAFVGLLRRGWRRSRPSVNSLVN